MSDSSGIWEETMNKRSWMQSTGISLDLPRIPCRYRDENSREGHGGVSGFTINSNWKTDTKSGVLKREDNKWGVITRAN